ncbi:G-protein coupled receptor family C group 6 member A-like [Neolamprologus brichardi]|uniref:G-protein coupled receptor family C group 6 member A-like n=1 Tax=Neolamprologus brichardi TaxID=32507 RepID=UPI001643BFD7|nr:G-protein coupled receptor family C group 6 member A-like [Neolamprologus brichardi]
MRGNCNTSAQQSSPVLAVIGGYYSEIAIAVTRLLNLEYIPEISYGATSGLLSDKTRFPSFMRTVPQDDHQARAISEILDNNGWTWVGVLTTDGEYARYITERLCIELAVKAIAQAIEDLCTDRDCKTKRPSPLEGNVTSRCTDSCQPGYSKTSVSGQPHCCYQCEPCAENTFSNTTDSEKCNPCEKNYYSLKGSSKCLPRKIDFLKWGDVYLIVLLSFTSLGAVLTIVVGIIFLAHWNTPVVRSSVGPISILLLLSLMITFASVILFGGQPNSYQCQARQVVFGLSFTLCVSCIMVKSFKIVLAFEFDPVIQSVLKKLYKPYLIIAVCMAGQVVIVTTWLIHSPPTADSEITQKNMKLMFCNEKLIPAFGAMLAYIGLLALICFGVAFKGRKLPDSYNDAKFITFAMLIYFISWIVFGPVYVNVTDKYIPAVEMVVILISAYGILFCQFFTKCYIILCKKEANTEKSFRWDIRNYSRDHKGSEDELSFSVSIIHACSCSISIIHACSFSVSISLAWSSLCVFILAIASSANTCSNACSFYTVTYSVTIRSCHAAVWSRSA